MKLYLKDPSGHVNFTELPEDFTPPTGWEIVSAPPEEASALRYAISERYDQLKADGLDCTLSNGRTICVLGRDISMVGGKAAVATLLVMLNPAAAAATALSNYVFKDTTTTLNYGELAELGAVYEQKLNTIFHAHKRAKDAIDAGGQPDSADMAILGL